MPDPRDSRDVRDARPAAVYIAVAVLSLAASAWAVWSDPVINTDGTLYVRAAEAITAGAWSEAMRIYPWPFYPALIGTLSRLSGLSAESSAHVVNGVLYALLSAGFVALVRQLGGSRRTLVAAAILVLAAAPLNEQRSLVIRDAGAIAFQVLGLIAFLRIREDATWRRSLAWGVFMTAAALFRPEALIPFVFAPAALLFGPCPATGGRWRRFFRAHAILLFIAASIGALALCAPESAVWNSLRSSRLAEPITLLAPLTRIVTRTLPNRATSVSRTLFGEPDTGVGAILVVVGFVAVVGIAIAQALTLPHAVLALHAFARKHFRPAPAVRRVWWVFVALQLLILVIVALIHFGVTQRSALFLALLLAVPSSFSLAALYGRWREGGGFAWRRDLLLVAVAVALGVTLVDGLVAFGSSKHHLREAGLWLRDNTPEHAVLFTNDTTVGHYARRSGPPDDAPIANRSYRPWEQVVETLRGGRHDEFDVVAIRLRRGQRGAEALLERLLGATADDVFANERGDRVVVFRRVQPAREEPEGREE